MNLQQNIPLKNYSSYKIGGPAKFFVEVESVEELKEVLRLARLSALDMIAILAGGTNVLISDEGFDGLVILNRIGGIIEGEGSNLTVGSGTLVSDFLAYCTENSFSGFEWAGGLPGTIGGAIRGNAGAFKGEIKDAVVGVESLDLKTLNEKIRNNAECQFAYRNNRHPMDYPNIGSIFKNIPLNLLSNDLQKEFSSIVKTDPFPVVSTTKLLALCGLKGRMAGGAMISDKHPNFIINVNNAMASDVKALIEIAKQTIKEKYGIFLEEEIVYLD